MSCERAASAMELVNSRCRLARRTCQRPDTGTNKTYSLLALRNVICSSWAVKRDRDDAYFTLFTAAGVAAGDGCAPAGFNNHSRQKPSTEQKKKKNTKNKKKTHTKKPNRTTGRIGFTAQAAMPSALHS